MTDITPRISETKKLIESYGNGGFRVTGERFDGNIIILPDSVHAFTAASVEAATLTDIKTVIDNSGDIEVLLVGAGKTTDFFETSIEKAIRSHKISIEYMDTGAAARTYNVLLSEERKVAVMLIAV